MAAPSLATRGPKLSRRNEPHRRPSGVGLASFSNGLASGSSSVAGEWCVCSIFLNPTDEGDYAAS